jgi:hypothetical protein
MDSGDDVLNSGLGKSSARKKPCEKEETLPAKRI